LGGFPVGFPDFCRFPSKKGSHNGRYFEERGFFKLRNINRGGGGVALRGFS
jgi:hypothetical protein